MRDPLCFKLLALGAALTALCACNPNVPDQNEGSPAKAHDYGNEKKSGAANPSDLGGQRPGMAAAPAEVRPSPTGGLGLEKGEQGPIGQAE